MKNILFFGCLILFIIGCKEKYEAPIESTETGYLVVEGVILSGNARTNLILSRTTSLNDATKVFEKGASIQIEGEDNRIFPLTEIMQGNYSTNSLNLNNNLTYRLRIKTQEGKEYLSDFVPVVYSPPIDSIPWTYDANGIQLYVDTHNPLNNTRYYQWEYIETWNFVSSYESYLKPVVTPMGNGVTNYDVAYKFPSHVRDESVYKCWKSDTSKTLILGSSAKLVSDIIHLPLAQIPKGSKKLSLIYSINVTQYACTKEAYEFLERLMNNSEQLGSVFDPQPSQLSSNITCISDPSEPVIGFVRASTFSEKRTFIKNELLLEWGYRSDCYENRVERVSDSIVSKAFGLYPTSILDAISSPSIIGYTPIECVDCTVTGTNIKPIFWPF